MISPLSFLTYIVKLFVLMIVGSLLRRQCQAMTTQISKQAHVPTFAQCQSLWDNCWRMFYSSNWATASSNPLLQSNNVRMGASSPSGSTLTARILPKDQVDYQQRKPVTRRQNVAFLREQVVVHEHELPGVIPEDTKQHDNVVPLPIMMNAENWVVVLDVHLSTNLPNVDGLLSSSSSTTSHPVPIDVGLHLHRQAHESALRTLQRLEISARRKVAQNRLGRKKPAAQAWIESSSSVVSENINQSSYLWVLDNDNDSEGKDQEDLQDGCRRRFQVDEDMQSCELWNQLSKQNANNTILSLDIKEESDSPPIPVQVDACPPTILSVRTFEDFTASVFVGVPLVIETEVVHAERALIVWFANGRQVAYDSTIYTPTREDIGKELCVLISPIRQGLLSGYEEAFTFEQLVQPRPPLPVVEMREASWCHRQDPSKLRVMSYNLLADLYTSRQIDQQHMYNHCQPEFLRKSRRMPLLVYEILAYQPDIICLQEVDTGVFDELLRPVLGAHGYHGYYSNKASAQLEGCAMFWSLRCFEKEADQQDFALRELFEERPPPSADCRWKSMHAIHNLLDQHQELQHVTRDKVGQVLQVATLRLKDTHGRSDRLVIGNTHLFYHPMADHIRVMQAYATCRQIDEVRREGGSPSESSSPPCPLILCGDLNSDPLSGAVRLLLHRQVEADHFETWKNLYEYSWDKGEHDFLMDHGFVGNQVNAKHDPIYVDESFQDANEEQAEVDTEHDDPSNGGPPKIELPPCFPNLISGYVEIPEFTNYAVDFTETLDYILASEPDASEQVVGFEAWAAAPVPTSLVMKKEYVAMPNEFMPSDHVSIVCDLTWKQFGK